MGRSSTNRDLGISVDGSSVEVNQQSVYRVLGVKLLCRIMSGVLRRGDTMDRTISGSDIMMKD